MSQNHQSLFCSSGEVIHPHYRGLLIDVDTVNTFWGNKSFILEEIESYKRGKPVFPKIYPLWCLFLQLFNNSSRTVQREEGSYNSKYHFISVYNLVSTSMVLILDSNSATDIQLGNPTLCFRVMCIRINPFININKFINKLLLFTFFNSHLHYKLLI